MFYSSTVKQSLQRKKRTILYNILLMVRGNKIIELFKAQSFKFVDSEYESKIGFGTAFIQSIVFLTLETSVVLLSINSAEGFIFFKVFNFVYSLLFRFDHYVYNHNINRISKQNRFKTIYIIISVFCVCVCLCVCLTLYWLGPWT